MKTPFSTYLESIAPVVMEVIALLRKDYDYVSALCTDSKGLEVTITQHTKHVSNETMMTERGVVFRVYKDGQYSEYALNTDDMKDAAYIAELVKKEIGEQLDLLKSVNAKTYTTPILDDEPITFMGQKDVEILPEEADVEDIATRLKAISDKGMSLGEHLIECYALWKSTHVCKMFLSENRDLRQAYVYSEGAIMPIASRDGKNKQEYASHSGMGGCELLSGLEDKLEVTVRNVEELLDATAIVPGEYEIITCPEVTGLIAHEAFGHGVEMDMFVKNRALGKEYIDKRVGSDQVTMHEGALCADDVASYFFDDEGTMAGDVIEIDHGILKTGICDALSALRLGIKPTGNGKRENFAHKAYTRMTNTVFDSGEYTMEEMIASVKKGYLLEGMESGMEDPKHWGIQCIISKGREIIDGKLTGKVVAPIIMTGYVPDLLGNITMCSKDRQTFGAGGCGKGYKEWVKVSDGGPYLKTKGILG